jgi:hypothetical protein
MDAPCEHNRPARREIGARADFETAERTISLAGADDDITTAYAAQCGNA